MTLGGDGTNRAVAKCSGDVLCCPCPPAPTTSFPSCWKGRSRAGYRRWPTGIAAGNVSSSGSVNIYKNGELIDIALIDAVITDDLFVGSRALWDPASIKEIFVTAAKPDSIGISAIAGSFHPMSGEAPGGLYIKVGEKEPVDDLVAIAPG